MKKSTLLFALILAISLTNAANAQGNCKVLKVIKSSFYALDVVYKDCDTKKQLTQRMALADDTRTFLVDPEIKSGEDLRINMVAGLHNPLWESATAGNGWTVECSGSVAHPECQGTPVNPPKCNTLKVENQGWYIAQVNYQECVSKHTQHPQLWKGESGSYLVEPNTEANINIIAGGEIWPKTSIEKDYSITCGGYLPTSKAWCKEAGKITKK